MKTVGGHRLVGRPSPGRQINLNSNFAPLQRYRFGQFESNIEYFLNQAGNRSFDNRTMVQILRLRELNLDELAAKML